MRFKPVMTWDKAQHKLRLFRVIWERGIVGDGNGYSAAFSVALMPKLFQIVRTDLRFRIVLLGLSLHWQRSYGGRFV